MLHEERDALVARIAQLPPEHGSGGREGRSARKVRQQDSLVAQPRENRRQVTQVLVVTGPSPLDVVRFDERALQQQDLGAPNVLEIEKVSDRRVAALRDERNLQPPGDLHALSFQFDELRPGQVLILGDELVPHLDRGVA